MSATDRPIRCLIIKYTHSDHFLIGFKLGLLLKINYRKMYHLIYTQALIGIMLIPN